MRRKVYVCEFCKKKFRSISRLQAHIIVHTKEKRYKCKFCSQLFCYRSSAKTHAQCHADLNLQRSPAVSAGSTLIEICQLCNKKFGSKSHLEEHLIEYDEEKLKSIDDMIEFIGSKVELIFKPARTPRTKAPRMVYVCQFCKTQFKSKVHLEIHITKHTKEKRYKCTFCGKLFCTKSAAKLHAQRHVSWKCGKCNKHFANRKRLTMHSCPHSVKQYFQTRSATSRDFQLDDMNEFIGSRASIVTDYNASKNNHFFVCQFCNKKFRHKPWLDNHVFVHTKENR